MIRELLALDEGRSPSAYPDSLGFLTIGVGHLIDARKGGQLPEPIIDALLDYDIAEKTEELKLHCPWIAILDQVRRDVLIDMAFNLGAHGLLGFTHFMASMEAKNYILAAEQMLQSKWAVQVGLRAQRLSKMVSTGEYPKELTHG